MIALDAADSHDMTERLLGATAATRSSTSTDALSSDFELVSDRETLVFEGDAGRRDKRRGLFQTYFVEKIRPGSGTGHLLGSTQLCVCVCVEV